MSGASAKVIECDGDDAEVARERGYHDTTNVGAEGSVHLVLSSKGDHVSDIQETFTPKG